MWIAIAIVGVIALAVIGLLVTARSRATTGRLSRETRSATRRPVLRPSRPAAAPAGEESVAEDDRRGPGAGRRGPSRHRVGRLARCPSPRAAATPVVYEPVDLDELGVTRRQFFNRSILAGSGLGLGAFGVAVARLPLAGREQRLRRQGRRRLGGRRQDRHRQQDAVLQRHRQDLHRRLPQGRPPEGQEGDGLHPADHRRDGGRVTSRSTRSACTSAAACRGARARSGSSARATARSTTRSVRRSGGPAPRGLDRFVLEVSGGNIVVDTGNLVLGPPIGTNTIDQSPEGPLCV